MILKNAFAAIMCAMFLAGNSRAVADEYYPDQLLKLDLSKAVFSPKRLGPAAVFTPVPVEAKADGEGSVAQGPVESIAHPRIRPAHLGSNKRYVIAHTRHVHPRGDPLNAQALDTRIQVWPCRSGGICNWKR